MPFLRVSFGALVAALVLTSPAGAVEKVHPDRAKSVPPELGSIPPEPHHEGGEDVVPASPLTPVVPEPEAPPKRAYQLYWQLDVPLLVSAGVLSLGRSFRTAKGSAPG